LGIKTSLVAQPTSKQISIILLHWDYSKICSCNTLSCDLQQIQQSNSERGAHNFGFLVGQRNLGFLCPIKKCIGGRGRENALGLTSEAPEEFAFGSTWDALGLQAKEKEKEQLLMIPQSDNVLSAASAIVMCKIKLFA
jgi:hypothetical protein